MGEEHNNPRKTLDNALLSPIVGSSIIASSLVTQIPEVAGDALPFFASAYLVPQLVKSLRLRNTTDLALGFLTLEFSSCSLFACYSAEKGAMPIVISSMLAASTAGTLLYLKTKDVVRDMLSDFKLRYYDEGRRKIKHIGASMLTMTCAAGAMGYAIANSDPGVAGIASISLATIDYAPQARRSLLTGSTDGLSLMSLTTDFSSCSILLTYGIMKRDWTMITMALMLLSFMGIPLSIKSREVFNNIRRNENNT